MNSLTWKRRIAQYYSPFTKTDLSRNIILIYHAVGRSPWAISEITFRQQMAWLSQHCHIVTLNDLLSSNNEYDKTAVAITFDDGYACLHDIVAPVLQDYHAFATVYINTGWISEKDNAHKNSDVNLGHYPNETFLNWREVKTLQQNGWEIGSHGVDHIDLTAQPEMTIQDELIRSKNMIEAILKSSCKHFAYTWGRYNLLLQKKVREAKYYSAVSGIHGTILSKKNVFSLPRMNVALEYEMGDFVAMIEGQWDYLKYIQLLKKKFNKIPSCEISN